MLLCLLLASLSSKGRAASKLTADKICNQVVFIEFLLGMEEFLKRGVMTLSRIDKLQKTILHFHELIKDHSKRDDGNGNKLMKNHLCPHPPECIQRWGPPSGWDSAPSESHHKTEMKGLSKNAQRNPSTLIWQTWKCKRKKHIFW